jgi:four helix bundle protein
MPELAVECSDRKKNGMPIVCVLHTFSLMIPERRKVSSYRDLTVWQRSMDLADVVHEITRSFPKDERFGLTSQIERSAASIPSNIAEGHGRSHLREYLHHLSMARGSLMELETQLTIAARRQYVSVADQQRAFDLSGDVGRLLGGLVRALKRLLPSQTPRT